MDISRFYTMNLNELEENAYALQIKYNPPLQEKDRDYVLRKIEKLKKKFEDISLPNEYSPRRKSEKKCNESILLPSGTSEQGYKMHMLVFVPYEGKTGVIELYRCFDRYHLRQYVQEQKDPYTGKPFTAKQMRVIEKALSIKYPNIPVGSRIEEIQKRLFSNETPSYFGYDEKMQNFLKSKWTSIGLSQPIYLEQFCKELTPSQYNLFMDNPKIDEATSRDKAAYITLTTIFDHFSSLEKQSPSQAKNYLCSIGNAIDEFYYMIYTYNGDIQYQKLLDEKGKHINNNSVTELYWKPSFLVELRNGTDGPITERYYLSRDGSIADGSRFFYDGTAPTREYVYKSNKVIYINIFNANGKIITRYPIENSLIHGNVLFYYDDGEKKMGVVAYYRGLKKGSSTLYYENGNEKEKFFYRIEEEERRSIPQGKCFQNFENGNHKYIFYFSENGILQSDEEYYSDGVMKQKKTYENGLLNGPYMSFYPTGKKESATTYSNGEIEGEWRSFYENGNEKEISFYIGGKMEGERILFYMDGVKEMECFMENGEEHGDKKEYYPSGILKNRIGMEAGEVNGNAERYYEDGSILERSFYQNGTKSGKYISFFKGGLNKRKECNYIFGKKEGECILFFDNGNIRKKTNYRNGLKNGKTESYYISGSLKKECICVDDKKGGIHKKYFPNGTLSTVETYLSGVLEGEYSIYFENGNVKEEGVNIGGQKNGMVRTYRENGTLKTECEYVNDMPGGSCVYFYGDGVTIQRRCGYIGDRLEGLDVSYYRNGQISEIKRYRNGVLSGSSQNYDENGTMVDTLYSFADSNIPCVQPNILNVIEQREPVYIEDVFTDAEKDVFSEEENEYSEDEEDVFTDAEKDVFYEEENISPEEEKENEYSEDEEDVFTDAEKDIFSEEENEYSEEEKENEYSEDEEDVFTDAEKDILSEEENEYSEEEIPRNNIIDYVEELEYEEPPHIKDDYYDSDELVVEGIGDTSEEER